MKSTFIQAAKSTYRQITRQEDRKMDRQTDRDADISNRQDKEAESGQAHTTHWRILTRASKLIQKLTDHKINAPACH